MWSALNAYDINATLTAPEISLFNEGDSFSTASPRLDSIISWVVDSVRAKVAACAENRNVMGPVGTIPSELYGDAIAIARYQLLTSFPAGKNFLDEGRTRTYTDALKHLDDVAAGKLAIEPSGGTTFAPDLSAFGSRDDDICNPANWCNRNVIDWGGWH
jgi:phage gp36-like protein